MNQEKVTTLVQEHAEITTQEIADFIHADWHEGEEHTIWLESASDAEIADWVIAGHPDQIKAREAGRAAMACHFEKVDEAMEAVNRLKPILARAVLAEIACSYPEDVLRVAREVEQAAQGPRCPNAIAREEHAKGLDELDAIAAKVLESTIEEVALLKARYAQLNDVEDREVARRREVLTAGERYLEIMREYWKTGVSATGVARRNT